MQETKTIVLWCNVEQNEKTDAGNCGAYVSMSVGTVSSWVFPEMYPAGLVSKPILQSRGVCVNMDGSGRVVLGYLQKDNDEVADGETLVFSQNENAEKKAKIFLSKDGKIIIKNDNAEVKISADGKLEISCENIDISAKKTVKISGEEIKISGKKTLDDDEDARIPASDNYIDADGKLTRITLVRTKYDEVNKVTEGHILINGKEIPTLEPQMGSFRGTIKSLNGVDIPLDDKGCLPLGEYRLGINHQYINAPLDDSKYKSWLVYDEGKKEQKISAGNRVAIYIHGRSNNRKNTIGCILVGKQPLRNWLDPSGRKWSYYLHNEIAENGCEGDVMEFLYSNLSHKECILEIINEEKK